MRHGREQPKTISHLLCDRENYGKQRATVKKEQVGNPCLSSVLRGEQLRLLEPVQESVLRAFRRPLPGGFAQLGQRRQASPWSASLVSAERLAILVLRQSHSPQSHASSFSAAVQCCLTPRSSRAPTACHAGPVGGTLYIFANRARAPHRWCWLNSNVRPRNVQLLPVATREAMGPAPPFGCTVAGSVALANRLTFRRSANSSPPLLRPASRRSSVSVQQVLWLPARTEA